MKIIALIFILVAVYAVYEYVRTRPFFIATVELVENARAYERAEGGEGFMLVLGDSTAVGIGATRPEDSIAGRIAATDEQLVVENHAFSGARSKDLVDQLHRAKRERYDRIIVQIGANDVIRFQGVDTSVALLRPTLNEIRTKSDAVIFLMAGNVGGAAIFPHVLRPLYHQKSLQYHAAFESLARELGITYVNLYTPPEKDVFVLQPEIYLSADRLHPSSEGYRMWYEKVREAL